MLSGSTVVDEKAWSAQVLAGRATRRLQGIVTRNDLSSNLGSLTWIKYTSSGNFDSLLDYDTTVFVAARPPVSSVNFTYLTVAGKDHVMKALRAYQNEASLDTAFEYDAQGRLTVLTVTLKTGTTVDSLFYDAGGALETRSYARGKLTQVLKHSVPSTVAKVDSTFSMGDSGLVLARVVKSVWNDTLLLSSRTFVNKGGLTANQSDRYVYNGLGVIALRYVYTESGTQELAKSETYSYNAAGQLARVAYLDETSGDLEFVQEFLYGTSAAPAAKMTATQIENRQTLLRLSANAAPAYTNNPTNTTTRLTGNPAAAIRNFIRKAW